MGLKWYLLAGGACLCASAGPLLAQSQAADTVTLLPDVQVIAASPIGGAGVDRAKVPAASAVLRRDDLVRSGSPSLLRALDEQAGGVTIQDVSGSQFAPNLLYRGFEASALVGNPQGLAVYVNGTRFNQSFSETVNFDLIPDKGNG